jgi:hypothetical protein
MTHHTNPDATPDFAALMAGVAARPPEQTSARQARIDSWEIGAAALQLGEQFLADGDLATARSWFEIAVRHHAVDATERLATVAVLAEAMADAGVAEAAARSPLAGEDREPHQDRDDTVERLDAAADMVRAAHAHAESIIAAAHEQARQIREQAHASTAAASPTDATNSDLMVAFRPDVVIGHGRWVLQAKCHTRTDDAGHLLTPGDQAAPHQVRRGVQAEMAAIRAHFYHQDAGDLDACPKIPVAAPSSGTAERRMSAAFSLWSRLHLADAWDTCTVLKDRTWTHPAPDDETAALVRAAWRLALVVDVQRIEPLLSFRLQPVSDLDATGLWLPNTVAVAEDLDSPGSNEDEDVVDSAVRQQAGCV